MEHLGSLPRSPWNEMHQSPSFASSIHSTNYKLQLDRLENESVHSVLSEHRGRHRRHNHHHHQNVIPHSNSTLTSPLSPYHPTTGGGGGRSVVGIGTTTGGHHHRTHSRHSHHSTSSRHHHRHPKLDTIVDLKGEKKRDDIIEVQILPQDDNWPDNQTAITGATSDRSCSIDTDLNRLGEMFDADNTPSVKFMTLITGFILLIAFLSPIVMIIAPKIDQMSWKIQECGAECDGILISFCFKIFILLIITWAIFARKQRANMPRIFVFRAALVGLITVVLIAFWLFFLVRIADKRHAEYELSYYSIVQFACSILDTLLLIHYAAIILLYIKQQRVAFYVKVVRSPDGESRSYNLGELSIQRAAACILEFYYRDFSIYNPFMDSLPIVKKSSMRKNGKLKYYDIDGVTRPLGEGKDGGENGLIPNGFANPLGGNGLNGGLNGGLCNGIGLNGLGNNESSLLFDQPIKSALKRGGQRSSNGGQDKNHHNERFYEENEYEKRVKKRRARLISATEEAFTHIRRLQADEPGPAVPMHPSEAAQAIFPTIARSMQKYLRITRQQPRHTMQTILDHLSICLQFDLSPRTFLEKYLTAKPVLQNDFESRTNQTWGLICDILLTRTIENGTIFMLRQGDVSLLVTVHNLPHLNLTEEIIDPKSNKFALRMNSETSV